MQPILSRHFWWFCDFLALCVLVGFFSLRIPDSNFPFTYPSDILFVLHWLFCWQWKWGMQPEFLCIANPLAAPSILPKIAFIGGLCSCLYIHFPFIPSLIPCKPSLWMPIRQLQVCGLFGILFYSSHISPGGTSTVSHPDPCLLQSQSGITALGWNPHTGQPAGSCPQLFCQETGIYMLQTLLSLNAGKQSLREICDYSQGETCLPVNQLECALWDIHTVYGFRVLGHAGLPFPFGVLPVIPHPLCSFSSETWDT